MTESEMNYAQEPSGAQFKQPEEPDEPEGGINQPSDEPWSNYPIDTLLIRTESRTVHDILRRISQGAVIMDPEFQRDFVWSDDKQSKLIESVLMRIPLPVFYLAEDRDGNLVVVDGLQRLATFRHFVTERQLRLKLPEQPELDKKKFEELPPRLRNRVEDCQLTLYVIDSQVPEKARLDIFDRVNSGEPLTRQQMRNALYQGAATDFLKTQAQHHLFVTVTGKSLNRKKMFDREFVNRYCAFSLTSYNDYRDMDEFLARALETINADPSLRQQLEEGLHTSLSNNQRAFGVHAFRKHRLGAERRSVLNASLWDVMSTGLAQIPSACIDESLTEFRDAFYSLLGDPEFERSITYGPNTPKQVRHRFEAAYTMLSELFPEANIAGFTNA